MTPDDVVPHFSDANGGYRFARWGRPIVPVVFGLDDATLAVVKGAIEAVVALAGHQIGETDPEMGANLMVFFVAEWGELADVPELEGLIPEMGEVLARLQAQGANQYRMFRFESDGLIRAAFVFLRMDDGLAEMAAEDLALVQAVQVMLVWGVGAFGRRSPLAVLGGVGVLRPEIAALIRAAYDPVLPSAADDASHALWLSARISLQTNPSVAAQQTKQN